MDFLIDFEGRRPEWIPYSKDLDDSVPYGDYVMSQRPLFLLRFQRRIADKQRADLNRRAIVDVQPQDRVYIVLRIYGEAWYVQRELPDTHRTIHVVEVQCTRGHGPQQKKIYARCLL